MQSLCRTFWESHCEILRMKSEDSVEDHNKVNDLALLMVACFRLSGHSSFARATGSVHKPMNDSHLTLMSIAMLGSAAG